MSARHLPDFPVDDTTLGLVEDAVNTTVDAAEGFTLNRLLDFMYGQDKEIEGEPIGEAAPGVPIFDMTARGPKYHPHDVIRSLVAEVRRLRVPGERP